jgi:transposase
MNNNGFLGLDISKGYADLYVINSDKIPVEAAFRLYDVQDGHQRIEELIDKWFEKQSFETLYCGVESTGGYENNWINLLQELAIKRPLKIARLNAKGVKSLSDAALKRTITDSVSAENIAMYLVDFRHKIKWIDDPQSFKKYTDGRRHNTFIRMLKKQRIQLSNQLEKLLYQELSPILTYCGHGAPGWLLNLLLKHSSVAAINKAGVKGLSKIKGITTEKAEAILNKTRESKHCTSAHISSVIKGTIKQMLHLDETIKEEKNKLIAEYSDSEEVKLLTSISGLGNQSAVEILIEIENIHRFEDAKKLSAYFGLHPVFKQSGDGKWGNHMSKKGRSEIRAVLFMSSLTAIRYSDLFKNIYSNARAKGKNHFNAMGVVMHKLLRVIYGVLKNKIAFSQAIDAKNVENAELKQQAEKEKSKEQKREQVQKLERYNRAELDHSPISKRHAKKRKVLQVT